MAKGRIPGLRNASSKEVRELSKLPWTHDEALSMHGSPARILSDGRVLLFFLANGSATLCPSRAVAEEMKRRWDETGRKAAEQSRRGRVDPSLALLPPIDDFLRDVEAHAKSLGPRLRIPDEVLDGTPESLDAVDKALRRIPWAKRQVPDLVTPLVAYLGEVMRKGSRGRWSKGPTTQKRRVPVFDPDEMAVWGPAYHAVSFVANEAAEKAGKEARARRASKSDVASAINAARTAAYDEIEKTRPQPIRIDEIEEPIRGNENEPVIETSGGMLFEPFASVYLPMVEPSRRVPLRSSPGVPYRRPSLDRGTLPEEIDRPPSRSK
jgi:hypothetical protein